MTPPPVTHCGDCSELKNAYFGDLHVHTSYSFDAYDYGTRTEPAAAYAFARGASVDIAKRGMSRKQLTWTRNYLLGLQNAGLVDAEEEFRQRVFHVTVYKDYAASTDKMAESPVIRDQAR